MSVCGGTEDAGSLGEAPHHVHSFAVRCPQCAERLYRESSLHASICGNIHVSNYPFSQRCSQTSRRARTLAALAVAAAAARRGGAVAAAFGFECRGARVLHSALEKFLTWRRDFPSGGVQSGFGWLRSKLKRRRGRGLRTLSSYLEPPMHPTQLHSLFLPHVSSERPQRLRARGRVHTRAQRRRPSPSASAS